MKTLLSIPICLLLLATFNIAQANTESAETIVKDTADKVIARLVSDRAELDAHPERIYSLVDELVIPHFDFVSMSKWVLGRRNWTSSTEEQQDKFVDEFKTLLVRTYAKALLEYSEQEIKYLPVESDPNSNIVVVKTQVQQPGAKVVPINYSMHISGGEWKVIDVVVDGISLVATYRGSFATEIRNNGMDGLLAKLSQRNSAATEASASQ